jgi:hypothetical protein
MAWLSCTAHADPTVVTSPAAFLAATQALGTDTFGNLPLGVAIGGPLGRTAGVWTYSVSSATDPTFYGEGSPVPPGLLAAAGSADDPWLSTNAATDTLRFSALGGASAIGGFFFGSDIDGAFAAGVGLTLVATDTSGSVTVHLDNATTGSFVGFIGDGALVSLTVSAVQPLVGSRWAAVNDLQLASAVPEPRASALALAGLLLLGIARRQRRS